MTAFAMLGVVLVAVVLVLTLRPLLAKGRASGAERSAINLAVYRDQARELDADLRNGLLAPDQHERARDELETRLLQDIDRPAAAAAAAQPTKKTAAALAALLPLGALVIYFAVGTPAALDPKILATGPQIDPQQLAAMVENLAQKLKEDPENGVGWAMLARSYRYFGRYEDAAKAYAQALPRLEPDASLVADYADTLATAQGSLAGEPEKLIARALEIDPNNLKALALAGSAAYNRKDFAGAVRHWERMVPLVPAGSEEAKAIAANVDEARKLAGSAAPAAAPTAAAGAAAARITGTVRLSPELAAKVAPTDTVLIYARPAEGSRMPLAIMQREARELPLSFTLDDSLAMAPGMTLSKFDRIVVAARVAKKPSASAQPGDLEGVSAPVANTASDVTVIISSEVR